jgi:hypothetical protein
MVSRRTGTAPPLPLRTTASRSQVVPRVLRMSDDSVRQCTMCVLRLLDNVMSHYTDRHPRKPHATGQHTDTLQREREIYTCSSRLGLIKMDHRHSGNARNMSKYIVPRDCSTVHMHCRSTHRHIASTQAEARPHRPGVGHIHHTRMQEIGRHLVHIKGRKEGGWRAWKTSSYGLWPPATEYYNSKLSIHQTIL